MAETAKIGMMDDRRKYPRYPFEAVVRHRLLDERDEGEFQGEVANMNSCSVYVKSTQRPKPGRLIKASIEWPVLLDGRTPLQLICNGVVARVDDQGFAIRFHKHEFRTKRTISITEVRARQAELDPVAKVA